MSVWVRFPSWVLNLFKMRNLLEKLKPEHLQTLDEQFQLYPNTTEDLKKILKENHSIMSVKFGHLCQLCSFLKTDINISDIFNLFEHDHNN